MNIHCIFSKAFSEIQIRVLSLSTGTRAASRPFAQWQLTEQNEEAARRALEDGYDVTGSLEKQIHAAVQQLVMNQWLDHRREILGIVGGSYLKGYS